MAELTASASSMAFDTLQTALRLRMQLLSDRIELWLEQERDQLALWVPVAIGTGIGLWFGLPLRAEWLAVILVGLAMSLIGLTLGSHRRIGQAFVTWGLCMALGCASIWWRASTIGTPVLAKPSVTSFTAEVVQSEVQGARDRVRLTVAPDDKLLPPKVRVNVETKNVPVGLVGGERVRLHARLLPPPSASLPGGYDFARGAWFLGLGATGRAIDKVERVNPPRNTGDTMHDQLTRLLLKRMPGSAGGIGASFISGDRGAISPADENSMRASGLTHLVSVSGLHITVAVTGTLLLTLRVLALFPFLALRVPLLGVAASVGAAMGIFYTIITGAEVPTIRSCVAALLVILGVVLGREAVTLRLVASGALVVLLLWPEALAGPSFQLSFIAVTSIVAFNEHPRVRQLMQTREDEKLAARVLREAGSLIVTGAVVEAALAPIAFFHFHRSGIYGAFANIIGIPLTTFFIMPMEALGLIFEPLHLSAPFWWLANVGLHLLLWISDTVAAVPGAVTMLPDVPVVAFWLVAFGGLWLMLWRSRARYWGIIPAIAGLVWALTIPAPDILITNDGRHMIIRLDNGDMAILRERAHDYVRTQLAAREGYAGPLKPLEESPSAQCNDDLCRVTVSRAGRRWTIVATKSSYVLPWAPFVALCHTADIVVSDRRLPQACQPRWLRADRAALRRTGGLAIHLATASVEQSKTEGDEHPWVIQEAQNAFSSLRREDIGD
jgi:competence protein ComEC